MSWPANEIVTEARKWVGTPYRHQASVLGVGCDCLGLLRGIWRALNGDEPAKMPPYRANWRDPQNADALRHAAEEFLLPGAGQPAIGDVVLFRMHRSMPPKHCGILVSDARFVHAQERLGVIEVHLTAGWKRRVSSTHHIPKQV